MSNSTKKKDVCVIVPMHSRELNELETYSFHRIAEKYTTRDIFVVFPKHLEEYTNNLMSSHPNMKGIVFDDKYFGSVIAHMRFNLSLDFYETFTDYKYLLVCHVDVMVIKDDLDRWLDKGYDFIGAPVFEGYTEDKTQKMKPKGANGGFSLRNIESCIKIISSNSLFFSKLSSLWNMEKIWYWKLFRIWRDGLIHNYNVFNRWPRLNEDMYWSIVVPEKYDWYKVCPPLESLDFAFEAHPKLSFELNENKAPMAVHAWWRYDKEFVLEMVKKVESGELETCEKIAI